MSRVIGSLLAITTLGIATSVAAQEPAAPTETPKDPEGVRGISPMWEAVNAGDAAFAAQDYANAQTHYQAAIAADPQDPIGHLRMAELSLKQGELSRAQEFVTAGLRFGASDVRYKAQASFLLAHLREAQAAHDDALDSWRNYKALDGQLPAQPEARAEDDKGPLPPKVYTATADERTKAIEARKKLEADYKAVAERIKKNVEAADKATGGGKK